MLVLSASQRLCQGSNCFMPCKAHRRYEGTDAAALIAVGLQAGKGMATCCDCALQGIGAGHAEEWAAED